MPTRSIIMDEQRTTGLSQEFMQALKLSTLLRKTRANSAATAARFVIM